MSEPPKPPWETAALELAALRDENAALAAHVARLRGALEIYTHGHQPEWWLSDEPCEHALKALAAAPPPALAPDAQQAAPKEP
jgi:hypothetical protein